MFFSFYLMHTKEIQIKKQAILNGWKWWTVAIFHSSWCELTHRSIRLRWFPSDGILGWFRVMSYVNWRIFPPIRKKWIWKHGVTLPKTNSKFTPKNWCLEYTPKVAHMIHLKPWWVSKFGSSPFPSGAVASGSMWATLGGYFLLFGFGSVFAFFLHLSCTFAVRFFWREKWYHKLVLPWLSDLFGAYTYILYSLSWGFLSMMAISCQC